MPYVPLPPRPRKPPPSAPLDAAAAQALSTPGAQQRNRDQYAVRFLRDHAEDIKFAAQRSHQTEVQTWSCEMAETIAEHAAALGYHVTVYLDAWTVRPNGKLVLSWHPNGPGPGVAHSVDVRTAWDTLRGMLRLLLGRPRDVRVPDPVPVKRVSVSQRERS